LPPLPPLPFPTRRSSDLPPAARDGQRAGLPPGCRRPCQAPAVEGVPHPRQPTLARRVPRFGPRPRAHRVRRVEVDEGAVDACARSEEHTSELQSLTNLAY